MTLAPGKGATPVLVVRGGVCKFPTLYSDLPTQFGSSNRCSKHVMPRASSSAACGCFKRDVGSSASRCFKRFKPRAFTSSTRKSRESPVRSTALEVEVFSGVRKGTVVEDCSCFVGVARVVEIEVEVWSGVRKGTFLGARFCFVDVTIVEEAAASLSVRSTHSVLAEEERSMHESSRRITGSAVAERRVARACRLLCRGVGVAICVAVADVDAERRQTQGWLFRGSEGGAISDVRCDSSLP